MGLYLYLDLKKLYIPYATFFHVFMNIMPRGLYMGLITCTETSILGFFIQILLLIICAHLAHLTIKYKINLSFYILG